MKILAINTEVMHTVVTVRIAAVQVVIQFVCFDILVIGGRVQEIQLSVCSYLEFMIVIDVLYKINVVTVYVQCFYPGLSFDILKSPLKTGFFDMLIIQVSCQLVKKAIKILF